MRELRTPLIVGWTWLAALWLAFGELIPTKEQATGIVRTLYDTAGLLGDATVLGVFTFVAYLLGSLLEVDSARLAARPDLTFILRSGFLNFFFHKADLLERAQSPEKHYSILASKVGIDTKDVEPVSLAIATGKAVLAQSAELESRLLSEKREVYDYYDRLKESADLRINLAGAVSALGAAVAWRLYGDGQSEDACGSAVFAGLVLALALTARGFAQFKRSRTALLTAVTTGVIQSPLLQEWEATVSRETQQRVQPEDR